MTNEKSEVTKEKFGECFLGKVQGDYDSYSAFTDEVMKNVNKFTGTFEECFGGKRPKKMDY